LKPTDGTSLPKPKPKQLSALSNMPLNMVLSALITTQPKPQNKAAGRHVSHSLASVVDFRLRLLPYQTSISSICFSGQNLAVRIFRITIHCANKFSAVNKAF
jgi:hypothetical protein